MFKGGKFISTDKDVNGEYTETYLDALDVDEIKLWDYNQNAFHYLPLSRFRMQRNIPNQAQIDALTVHVNPNPIILYRSLVKTDGEFTIDEIYNFLIEGQRAPYFSPRYENHYNNLYDQNGHKIGKIPIKKALISDIVDQQFGGISPYVAGTSDILTALKFFVFRADDYSNPDGLLFIYKTNRSMNITYPKDSPYNRIFNDSSTPLQSALKLHSYSIKSKYNETIVSAGILPRELIFVCTMNYSPVLKEVSIGIFYNVYEDEEVRQIMYYVDAQVYIFNKILKEYKFL